MAKKNKMKTHRGTAKRVNRTGTGKLKRMQTGVTHMTGKMSQKRKRKLRKAVIISKGDMKRIGQMVPKK